jgi:hypothetical protein
MLHGWSAHEDPVKPIASHARGGVPRFPGALHQGFRDDLSPISPE